MVDELKARIAENKPAGLDVLAIFGTAADAKIPVTEQWPDEDKRKDVKVASLTITALDKNETCDEQFFDPTTLADGLAGPTDDPIFTERQPAYAISISQRL